MRAWLDCGSGISGDKFLGALVSAGFDIDALGEALAALGVTGLGVTAETVTRGGIAGTLVTVRTSAAEPLRDWPAIRTLIEEAELPDAVKAASLKTFTLLAEAEAAVHGVAPDNVHFHEVGAADSIADVVGVAAGLWALGVDDLVVSPVAVGSGSVETEHGTLPVPAPATALLLEGVPSFGGEVSGELTTPTGAALVRALAASYGPMPAMTPRVVGHGAGTRDLPIPNVARLILAEEGPSTDAGGTSTERVVVLETNLDHVTGEHLAWAAERLLEAGARDVWRTPIVMKKGRAGVALSVMTAPGDAARLAELMMELTGSLGIRRTETVRDIVPRRTETVKTSLGPVRVKVWLAGGRVRVRPEHDDVAAIASRDGTPYDEVERKLTAEAEAIVRW